MYKGLYLLFIPLLARSQTAIEIDDSFSVYNLSSSMPSIFHPGEKRAQVRRDGQCVDPCAWTQNAFHNESLTFSLAYD